MKTIEEIETEFENLWLKEFGTGCTRAEVGLFDFQKPIIKQFYRSKIIELIEGVKEIVPDRKICECRHDGSTYSKIYCKNCGNNDCKNCERSPNQP